MKNSKFTARNRRLLLCIMCFAFCISNVSAQSTRVEAPTPITANELSGRINARDVGDSRLTTYYYVFNGTQGDIFLKIQSANFNGDIDVFYAENLRPLTKISLYADAATGTGREIYLRKPEKLILRVEGRSPNDDPATFSIKFEGSSFQALATNDATGDTDAPRVKTEVTGAVRVNSVGTIIEPERKPEPEEKVVAETIKPSRKTAARKPVSSAAEKDENNDAKEESLNRRRATATNAADKTTAETPAAKNTAARTRTPVRRPARTVPPRTTTATKAPAATKKPPVERKTPPAPTKSAAELKAEELATALENVRLVVLMKNGDKLDRPMSEILRFSVDKGTLTIISKRGAISRYSILDVEKVSIE